MKNCRTLISTFALMICLLRNIVGFPTFGIFMPVLMALAFRNTGLLYGLGIFSGVILLGYGVRRSIDRLRLLLVPRLSVILTLVIVSFTVFALIGNKVGLREFMAGLLSNSMTNHHREAFRQRPECCMPQSPRILHPEPCNYVFRLRNSPCGGSL
jgi:hypothetical protein